MIDELHATDVALIKDASIHPSAKLTVLTGETGAGKTALLSALKLLVGERADTSSVRDGASALQVEGRVFIGEDDLEGHIVRRRVELEGRARTEIDGHMASVRELAELVGSTVDLCGQHEHQRLLDPSTHVDLLNAWAKGALEKAQSAYLQAFKDAKQAVQEVQDIIETAQVDAARLDEATFVLERIGEVDPKPGELEELEESLPRAEHAETLVRATEETRMLCVSDTGVTAQLSQAINTLKSVAHLDEQLAELASQLSSSLIDIEDAAHSLGVYRSSIELDQGALDAMQARMASLRGLMRTYGPSMDDVFAKRETYEKVLALSQNRDELLSEAQHKLDAAESELSKCADKLDVLRKQLAPELAAAISTQMARLEMGSAEVEVAIERLPRASWNAAGPSSVELMYRPGTDLAARPLRRIASGGEISRVMLACKVVLGEADDVDTLVFDEVDAGVGGATALALGAVLADLAQSHQVIVVTHLAQVAVMADCHYVVRRTEGTVPETFIEKVEGEQRVVEIARMLSGDASDTALAHAREMLAGYCSPASSK